MWYNQNVLLATECVTQSHVKKKKRKKKKKQNTSIDFRSFSISASLEDFATNGSPGVLSCNTQIELLMKT